MKSYPIKIIQVGILTGEELSQDGLICENNDEFYIDLNGDNVFYKFHDTTSRFSAILEVEKEDFYDIFELTLKEDYYLEDFEIEKDNEYKKMVAFFLKEKLNDSLSKKISKETKQKI